MSAAGRGAPGAGPREPGRAGRPGTGSCGGERGAGGRAPGIWARRAAGDRAAGPLSSVAGRGADLSAARAASGAAFVWNSESPRAGGVVGAAGESPRPASLAARPLLPRPARAPSSQSPAPPSPAFLSPPPLLRLGASPSCPGRRTPVRAPGSPPGAPSLTRVRRGAESLRPGPGWTHGSLGLPCAAFREGPRSECGKARAEPGSKRVCARGPSPPSSPAAAPRPGHGDPALQLAPRAHPRAPLGIPPAMPLSRRRPVRMHP